MNNWDTIELGEIVKSGGGKIHTGPFGSQLHASDYVDSGVPCIMPANMVDSRVDLSSVAFITESDAQRLSKYIVESGDIVYSRRGDVTLKALIREHEAGYFCGTGCLLLRPGSEIDSEFLTYYLSTSTMKEWIKQQAVGATMPNLNTGILSRIPFTAPAKKEQQKLSKVISLINKKIELNNKVNAELEAMAKLIYDYWFVQFDFPDTNSKPYKSSGGKMVYSEELNREIPDGWDSDYIENLLAKESRTKKLPKTEYLSEGKIPVIDQSTDYICGYTNDQNTLITTVAPRIVFGDHTRILKLVNFDFARGADGTQVLLSNNKNVPQHFFYHSLLKIDLSNYGYARHFKFLKQTRTIIPNQDVVTLFEKKMISFYNQIKHNVFETNKLIELRDWLLPMLMNGQVTVKDA